MSTPPLIDGYQTTPDERSMACLAHVLQVIGAWIAPLIIFVIKRESKFVAFHALQALFLQLSYLVVLFGSIAIFIVTAIATAAISGANSHQPPTALFVFFPLLWLAFMGCWILMLIAAIVYGMKANRGEWAQYPLIGGWVRRILHI